MLTNEKGHTKYGLFHDKYGSFAPFLALLDRISNKQGTMFTSW